MIYLDHAATTPLPEAVADTMYDVLRHQFGNPSAQYPLGREAKELVEEASGGVITVDVFPNDQLAGGNASKGIEMISDGSVDMAAYATSVLSALDERVSIGTVPWLFDSYAEAREVIDSTGLAYYDSVLERLDLKVIGSFHNGFRQLTNNKRPVTSPEDL